MLSQFISPVLCPFCTRWLGAKEVQFHFKVDHGVSCPRLTSFFDPRVYIETLRFHYQEDPKFFKANYVVQSGKKYIIDQSLPLVRKALREAHCLQLNKMLKQVEFERTNRGYTRKCFLCEHVVVLGSVDDFGNHLWEAHHFSLGNPGNLVYFDIFMECLERRLANFQCLFCAKVFSSRKQVKEHMRKQRHMRISQGDIQYDCFYSINYLDPERLVKDLRAEERTKTDEFTDDSDSQLLEREELVISVEGKEQEVEISASTVSNQSEANLYTPESMGINELLIAAVNRLPQPGKQLGFFSRNAGDYADEADASAEEEGGQGDTLACLICGYKTENLQVLNRHMKCNHDMDLKTSLAPLRTKERVRLINAIRSCVANSMCPRCYIRLPQSKLVEHINNELHSLPDLDAIGCHSQPLQEEEDEGKIVHKGNETAKPGAAAQTKDSGGEAICGVPIDVLNGLDLDSASLAELQGIKMEPITTPFPFSDKLDCPLDMQDSIIASMANLRDESD